MNQEFVSQAEILTDNNAKIYNVLPITLRVIDLLSPVDLDQLRSEIMYAALPKDTDLDLGMLSDNEQALVTRECLKSFIQIFYDINQSDNQYLVNDFIMFLDNNNYDSIALFDFISDLMVRQAIPKDLRNLNKLNSILKDDFIKKNIRQITLNSSQFRNIPDEIFELSNLVELNLANNNIDEIPNKINNLINLEVLILSNNIIRKLPDTMSKLKNLKELILPDNEIETFEQSLFQLENLEYLDLSNNFMIRTDINYINVPMNVSKLKNLITLNLSNLCGPSRCKLCLPTSMLEMKDLQELIIDEYAELECYCMKQGACEPSNAERDLMNFLEDKIIRLSF